MNKKGSANSQTTADQRKLLFRTWETTGSVLKACQVARVGRGTFYYWKPRFESDGYAGLEVCESRVPHEPNRTPDYIVQKVIEIRRKNPSLGKHQIAKELAVANQSVPVISPNTVRRILMDYGLWDAIDAEPADLEQMDLKSSEES